MVHCLCVTSKTHSLKQVISTHFSSSPFFFYCFRIAPSKYPGYFFCWGCCLVQFLVNIFSTYALWSKWFVDWVRSQDRELLSIIYTLLSPAASGRFFFRHLLSYFIQLSCYSLYKSSASISELPSVQVKQIKLLHPFVSFLYRHCVLCKLICIGNWHPKDYMQMTV